MIRKPSWDYGLLSRRDELNKYCLTDCPFLTNGLDDVRHKFNENTNNHKIVNYVIQFPDGVELSSKAVYAEANEDEDLSLKVIPDEYERYTGSKETNKVFWGVFFVARTDIKANKRGKVTIETKCKAAQLLDMLGTA